MQQYFSSLFGIAWENIFVGILSALLLTLGELARKRFRDLRLERKYAISGNYLTKFEDEIDGKKFTDSASATLIQRGRKISGETELINGSRKWKIEGQITDAGYIYGIYYSADPHDKGIGNYFLTINYDRRMEGIWSGYDSINKKIVSGKYYFTPVMKDFAIHDVNENDIPAILKIADMELGKDYLTESLLIEYATNKEKFVFQAAKDKEKIIGFCLSIISKKDEVKQYIKTTKLHKHFEFSRNVSILKTVAIIDDYKGRGVGTELVNQSLLIAEKNYGVRSFCSIGWKNIDKINMEGILGKFKFNFLQEIPEYWAAESLEKGFNCPACGLPPCKCPAVLYTKFI